MYRVLYYSSLNNKKDCAFNVDLCILRKAFKVQGIVCYYIRTRIIALWTNCPKNQRWIEKERDAKRQRDKEKKKHKGRQADIKK